MTHDELTIIRQGNTYMISVDGHEGEVAVGMGEEYGPEMILYIPDESQLSITDGDEYDLTIRQELPEE